MKNRLRSNPALLLTLACCLVFVPVQAAVILQYHHVDQGTPASTSITPELFAEHLDYLARHEFQVWPLTKVIAYLKEQQTLPDKVVAITFDDAYRSVYEQAYPLLKERAWPFTVFISANQISEKDDNFMSWGQLKEMADNRATIANHTRTHAHLVRTYPNENRQQWRERISQEIDDTEQLILKEVDQSVRLLAYPYGEYTNELKALVAELGYVGFGQQSGAVGKNGDLAALPRFPMTNFYGAMTQFPDKVHSLPLAVDFVSPSQHLIENDDVLGQGLTLRLSESYSNLPSLTCYLSPVGKVDLEIIKHEEQKEGLASVVIKGPIKLTAGRSRINCTLPSGKPEYHGRFHWFSHPWMRRKDDGSWYSE